MGSTNGEETQRKSLSTRESQALSRLASEKRQVITISDIVDALDIPRKSAKDMAYALKEKRWLERIAHGKYLVRNRVHIVPPDGRHLEPTVRVRTVEIEYLGHRYDDTSECQ